MQDHLRSTAAHRPQSLPAFSAMASLVDARMGPHRPYRASPSDQTDLADLPAKSRRPNPWIALIVRLPRRAADLFRPLRRDTQSS